MQCARHHFIFLWLALLLLQAPRTWAQGGQYGTIVGELRLAHSDLAGRILVELQLHGATISSIYSDEQGKFGFPALQANPYHVVVRDDRFYPIDQTVDLDPSTAPVLLVQIYLVPREPKTQNLPERTPGSNLYMVDSKEYRRQFPKRVLKEFDKGLESDRDGKRDEGIHHYQKALVLAPDFYPAHNNLGSDYLSKSDFKAAQAEFEQATKLNQSDAEAHLNLANLFLVTKNYDRALASVQDGLRRQPNSAFGQFLLGSIYERMGKASDAETALRKALELAPRMSRVHLELVNLYLTQHKRTEASTELKAFLRDSPNDPLARKAREVLNKLEQGR